MATTTTKMCDSCKSAPTTRFCRADSAFLCFPCTPPTTLPPARPPLRDLRASSGRRFFPLHLLRCRFLAPPPPPPKAPISTYLTTPTPKSTPSTSISPKLTCLSTTAPPPPTGLFRCSHRARSPPSITTPNINSSDLAEKLEQAENQLAHSRFGSLIAPTPSKKEVDEDTLILVRVCVKPMRQQGGHGVPLLGAHH